jgi:acyl transferase domain-containing protein/SAM-dependent methyltransferase
LLSKSDARTRVPESRYNVDGHYSEKWKPGNVKSEYGYFLDESMDVFALDTTFFNMSKAELERADPQQRQLLEVVRECFESAGETDYRGKDVACYVGSFGEEWCDSFAKEEQNYGIYRISGWGDFVLSNRISYEFDLKGPSMTIRTGCSSGLIGLHEACISIEQGICNAAIVGGVNLLLGPGLTATMSEQGVLSPDGSCKTFDIDADGYARGEAINAVYVKRLSDAIRDGNPIRAVIRSTFSNCDGKTPGIMLPSSESHESMIREAYAAAMITDYGQTGFIECHGTGTATGDPIEAKAIANVFGDEGGVYITSVKPNIGHSEGASGITSLIKAVLALEKSTIPPNIKFDTPNPKIPFDTKNLRVPTDSIPWPTNRCERAGVNSFGIGGANVHVILESARCYMGNTPPALPVNHKHHLLVHSANSSESLRLQVTDIQKYADEQSSSLEDHAYTLGSRREHLPHRAFSVNGKNTKPNTSPFSKVSSSAPDLVMLFTGQGAQWPRMGYELFQRNSVFKKSIFAMNKTLHSLPEPPSWSISDELAKAAETSNIHIASFSQPLCTAIQIALCDALADIGIRPSAVVGHSSGELAAAYAAGTIGADEAIIFAYYRGVMSGRVTRLGGMAAVGMGWEEVKRYLVPGVGIACENSPLNVTISGDLDRVEETLSRIRTAQPDVFARLLKVDKAYHSHHMKEVGCEYRNSIANYVSDRKVGSSALFFSSVTGDRLVGTTCREAQYWQSNLESPVRFRTAVANLVKYHSEVGLGGNKTRNLLFLDVGPHSALAGPLRQILSEASVTSPYISCFTRNVDSEETFLTGVGQLYLQNIAIDFDALTNPDGVAKVLPDLPTYPWQHDISLRYESRVTKEWRLRKFVKHELLGLRVLESTDNEPSWRNVLHLGHVPWVRDHNIQGDVILPCAGYMAMAGEAIRQLTLSKPVQSPVFTGYSLTNVVISTALVLSESHSTEIVTSLKKHRLTDTLDSSSFEFSISSFNGSAWVKHCGGLVCPLNEKTPLNDPPTPLPRSVNPSKWYETLRKFGANYGPQFQGITHISSATTNCTAAGRTTKTIPDDDDSIYSLHPTTIDFFLQLFSVSAAKGINRHVDKMRVPTFIERADVYDSSATIDINVSTTATPKGEICGGGQGVTSNGIVALRMKGVQLTPLEGQQVEESYDLHAAARLEWKPDVDFVDQTTLICGTIERKVYMDRLQRFTRLCIAEALRRLSPVKTNIPHLEKFYSWLVRYHNANPESSLDCMTELTKVSADLSNTLSSVVVVAMMKVLDALEDIFAGKVDPIAVLLADETLTELYNRIEQCYSTALIKTLGHSQPNLRVLEIGAGTGGTTNTTLRELVRQDGQLTYSEYTFTDISPGFFSAAKERFKEWPNVEYRVLDISKDPVDQGFQAESYDVIIATNVLHATSNLHQTLGNVRKLLHPDGRLILQELCPEEKSINFIMGVLPGWWVGAEDGREDEPYISPRQWQLEAKKAGFDEFDAVVLDEEDPFQLNAYMVARPTKISVGTRGVTILQHDSSKEIAKTIQKRLIMAGLDVDIAELGHKICEGREVLALLDLDAPFFESISNEKYEAFKSLVSNIGKSGVFWLTRMSQINCQDPRYSQVLGVARVLRSELSVDFATCEVDNIDSSLELIVGVFEKFRCRNHEKNRWPEYEYVISKGVVNIGRFYPHSIKETLVSHNCVASGDSLAALSVERYGRLNTLQWTARARTELKEGEIEVETRAVGLNFRVRETIFARKHHANSD